MACYRSRVWAGHKLSASALSGIGLAALVGGATPDAFAKSGRSSDIGVTVSRPAAPAVMAIVSLNQQRVTVYDGEGQALQSPVSTGKTGYETPAGIYSVLERKVEHYSNLYDDAAMPFMQRLTWSGIALHAGMLPGYPASAGCVRMPIAFAERLFERTRLGMRVIVVRDDIRPLDFTHPALFKPLADDTDQPMPGVAAGAGSRNADQASAHVAALSAAAHTPPAGPRRSARAVAAAKSEAAARAAAKAEEARSAARSATIEAARATRAIRRAEALQARAELQLRRAEQAAAGADRTGEGAERAQQAKAAAQAAFEEPQAQLERVKAEMQPKVDLAQQLRRQAKEAHEASVAAQEEAREAARKAAPVSVFISRTTQRLYVRQSREQVLETPVNIADPGKPLGTYVFTALAHANGQADLRWSVVSMYRSVNEPRPAGGKHGEHRHAGAAPADHVGARQALDRIAVPKEAIDRISELVGPGTSLIVSDEPLSRETGQATEFILVMSNEPQGGLKIRRRTPSLEARNRYQRPAYGGSPFGWSGAPFPWWR
jgi:pyruvate/2-oxoglutarate dehydrogenase complex dihydrolipoamide acyltransferase (E2) component